MGNSCYRSFPAIFLSCWVHNVIYLLFALCMKKWNISILVIFVLLASSLLGILSMNFVQQMMKQSALVHAYYEAYYISKAWIELGLAQTTHRWIGFNYALNSGDAVVLDNFLCQPNCSLSTTLSGTSSLLSKKFWQSTSCDAPYVLSGGQSIIVPLFRDNFVGWIRDSFTSAIQYQNLADLFKNDKIAIVNVSPPDIVTFWLLILSGENLHENGVFFKTWMLTTSSLHWFRSAFESYMTKIDPVFTNYYWSLQLIERGFKIYLMVSNTAQVDQSLCMQTSSAPLQVISVLPADTFFIKSQSSYNNQHVALDASYAQPIPGFLFSTYTSYQ